MTHYKGKLISHGVRLTPEETQTIDFLRTKGVNIELIPPVRRKGARTPDISIGDTPWEIKCPRSATTSSLTNIFKKAITQSPNLIFDLRHLNGSPSKAINTLTSLY